jgi:hypothetical protein
MVLAATKRRENDDKAQRLRRRRRRRQVLVAAGVASVAICAVVAATTQRPSRDTVPLADIASHPTTNVTTPRPNVTTPRLVGDDTCRILASSAILFPFQRPVNHERRVRLDDDKTPPVANDAQHALTIYRPPLVPPPRSTKTAARPKDSVLLQLPDQGRLFVKTCVERYWRWTAAAVNQAVVHGEFQFKNMKRGIHALATRDWRAAGRRGIHSIVAFDWGAAGSRGRSVMTRFAAGLHRRLGPVQLGRHWHTMEQRARQRVILVQMEFGRHWHSMEQWVLRAQERLPVVLAAIRQRIKAAWYRLHQQLMLLWERAQASAHLFHPGRNFLESE